MSSSEGIQFNAGGGNGPFRGRGRGGRNQFQGRGRGNQFQGRGNQFQGRGGGQAPRFVRFNNQSDGGFQYNQNRQFIPPIPQPFYKFLNDKFDSKVDGKDELKYPVINIHRSHVIKKFKLNSIISKDLLAAIIPGDDEESKFHFKKVYCSPNRIPNDGLYIEFQKFLTDITK